MKSLVLALVLGLVLTASTCATAPPTLSPAGAAAFHATRVVKILDAVRDVAIDAEAQRPPLLSTDTTRTVVTWHRAAVTTIGAAPGGWRPTVTAGLEQLRAGLPPADRALLAPYIDGALLVIREVIR